MRVESVARHEAAANSQFDLLLIPDELAPQSMCVFQFLELFLIATHFEKQNSSQNCLPPALTTQQVELP
jgi:hypothetical protein